MKRLRSGFGGCRVCFGGGRDRLEIGLEKTDEKGDKLWRIGKRVEKRWKQRKRRSSRTQHVAGDMVHPGDVSVDELGEILG
jgi:hypothetical protein